MNLTVTWDNEAHTVMRYIFTEETAPEDLSAAYALTGAMLDTVEDDTPVAVILDGTLASGRIRAATTARFHALLADLHPQARVIVLVEPNQSSLVDGLRKLLGGTRRLVPHRTMTVASTVQEARQIAHAHISQSAAV